MILLGTALLLTSQCFSQTTDTVWVEVRNGDTIVVMSPNKARDLASDLIKGDSCCARVQYLEDKIVIYQNIIEGDSNHIINLESDLLNCDSQNQIQEQQQSVLRKRLDISIENEKRYKRQRWIIGGSTLAGGVLIGIIVGVLVK